MSDLIVKCPHCGAHREDDPRFSVLKCWTCFEDWIPDRGVSMNDKMVEELSLTLGSLRAQLKDAELDRDVAMAMVARLRAVIVWAAGEIEGGDMPDDLEEVMVNESLGLSQCQCGILWDQGVLTWRPWAGTGLEISECTCGSTISRIGVRKV